MKISEILKTEADWCKGSHFKKNGVACHKSEATEFCLVGAISVVTNNDITHSEELRLKLLQGIQSLTGRTINYISGYNDEKETTFPMIQTLLQHTNL